MNITKEQLLLYGVTDRRWLNGRSLESQVEEAIKGGMTCVQLREKGLSRDAFIRTAIEMKKITDQYRIPLIINDDIEVMLAVDAAGIHVGQKDLAQIAKTQDTDPVSAANESPAYTGLDVNEAALSIRARIGADKILGVSARTPEQAQAAQAAGADYLGCGAVFGTGTKDDAATISPTVLAEVCTSVDIPVVAIGGVTAENAYQLSGTGLAGAAVVSGLFAQSDIRQAAARLKERLAAAVTP